MPETNIETVHFKIRFVPKDLHFRWKVIAAAMNITMEDFALQAINEKVINELNKRHGVISAEA